MQKKSLLATVRQALRGEHHDYTSGPIGEAVVLLSIPMILELSLESVFAVVDMFFVAKLGQNAIATVGLTEGIITIIYSIAIGLSTGATAIVARRIGEKNPEGAAHAGAQSLLLAVIMSIVLGIVGVIFASDLLALMGASPEVVAEGTTFAQIQLGGSLVIVLLFLINGIFRGAGDAAMAMKSLWLASGANIVLCPILIDAYGLKGAAIATVLGRAVGVAYQCHHLFKGDGELKFRAAHFTVDMPVISNVVKIASPASLQFLIGSGSWIVLTRLVAEVGGMAAAAGYQIAARSFMFFMLPAWGLSNAAATLVGQNLGAKQIDRAERSVWVTVKFSMIVMAFVTLIFVLLPETIVRIFTSEPAIVEYGTLSLRIFGAPFTIFGFGMVLTQALNGAGDTKTPTWINFVSLWLFGIPLAYALALGLDWKVTGVLVSFPAANLMLAVHAYYVFKKGKWKQVQV